VRASSVGIEVDHGESREMGGDQQSTERENARRLSLASSGLVESAPSRRDKSTRGQARAKEGRSGFSSLRSTITVNT